MADFERAKVEGIDGDGQAPMVAPALELKAHGIEPTPLPPKKKLSDRGGYTERRMTGEEIRAEFRNTNGRMPNLGALLGPLSGNLFDEDFDCPEALRLAPRFGLTSPCRFGRESNPGSHNLNRSEIPIEGIGEFRDLAGDDGRKPGDKLLEFRVNGHVVMPPSEYPVDLKKGRHEEERSVWGNEEGAFLPPPVLTEQQLEQEKRRFRECATATLVARHLPPEGNRHDFCLALCGFLLRPGRLDEVTVARILLSTVPLAAYSSYEKRNEAEKGIKGNIASTVKKLEGDQPATGGPELERFVPGLYKRIAEYWGFELREEKVSEAVRWAEEIAVKVRETGNAQIAFDPGMHEALSLVPDADYERIRDDLAEGLKRHGKKLNTNALLKGTNQARRERKTREGFEKIGDELPLIQVNDRPMRDKTDDALIALEQANDPPTVFSRGGGLARVRKDDEGLPVIDAMGEPHLRGRMDRTANFYVMSKSGPSPVSPPKEVVQDVLALGRWRFPVLQGVVEAPVLRPDGTVLTEPGYDPTTRLYYAPAPGLVVPEVPERPTEADIKAALGLLDEAVGEFPYDTDADKANLLALLLTPVARPAIPGHVPMALIDAPQKGTGKSLLAGVVPRIATGREAGTMTESRDDEEWRKRITSVLAAGKTVITIDNIDRTLESGQLSSALTTPVWEDRPLGKTELLRLPQRATWIGTGNNIVIGGDIPRRVYRVRLNAKTPRAWGRTGFTHPNLAEWVEANRGDLLAALLTLARAWFAAGQPEAESVPTLGNFDSWVRVVGGILAAVGVGGFLDNLVELYEEAEEESAQWETFLATWHQHLGQRPTTAKEVAKRVTTMSFDIASDDKLGEALRSTLSEEVAGLVSDPKFSTKFGKALTKQKDVRHGQYHLRRSEKKSEGAFRWSVVREAKAGEKPGV